MFRGERPRSASPPPGGGMSSCELQSSHARVAVAALGLICLLTVGFSPPASMLPGTRAEDGVGAERRCRLGLTQWCASKAAAQECGKEGVCRAAPESVRAAAPNRAGDARDHTWRWRTLAAELHAEGSGARCKEAGVIFMGDSITEALRGTSIRRTPEQAPWTRSHLEGQPSFFNATFGR
eukprot:Hpha_TRINITY_DN15718_c4_g5::TRINITY_DN15718_c4_g5_i1::g.41484::m.41484